MSTFATGKSRPGPSGAVPPTESSTLTATGVPQKRAPAKTDPEPPTPSHFAKVLVAAASIWYV